MRISRRKYLIYPRFQLALLTVNTVISLCIFGVLAIQFSRAAEALRQLGYSIHLNSDHPYFSFIKYQMSTLHTYLFFGGIFGLILSWVFTLVLSQRVAGPILRLEKYFQKVVDEGKPPAEPLSFRNNDFFEELPPVVNGAISALLKK
jgi:hypothetical protein